MVPKSANIGWAIQEINEKNSPVIGWGALSKQSNVKMSKERPIHPPTHKTIHPPIGGEVYTDVKSSNRIKISWFVQVL